MGDTLEFDEELQCDVVVRLTMDEIYDIADEALSQIEGGE